MSIVFLFDENPDVASAGSGGAAVGGARNFIEFLFWVAVASDWSRRSSPRLYPQRGRPVKGTDRLDEPMP